MNQNTSILDLPDHILTPVGRIVNGDCVKPQTTDADGNRLVVKKGANIGQPRLSYYVGLAILKTDPGYDKIYNKIYNLARIAFPQMFDATGRCIRPDFAFKITDGDSTKPDTKNIRPCDRIGFPGHWVLHFSNGFPPSYCTRDAQELITDLQIFKRGYYIRIWAQIKSNQTIQKPGVYLNHTKIEFHAYGEEIITGPTNKEVFGNVPVMTLPPGASTTPLAPRTNITPPIPPVPAQPVMTNVQLPPIPNVQPAPDFVNGPPPPPPPPSPTTIKHYLVDGKPFTERQLIMAGYNETQIQTLQTT